LLTSLGTSEFPRQPAPVIADLFSGRHVATDVIADRVMTSKPLLLQIGGGQVSWVTSGAPPHYLQPNANIAASTVDANVDAIFGQFSISLYSTIVRTIEAQRLNVVRDTVLDNSNAANPDSFGYFMSNYIAAFLTLRNLEALVNAGNYNQATTLISNAVNQNLMRLMADLDRLYQIPMAPNFMVLLDRLCGPKGLDESEPLIMVQLGQGTTSLDLTGASNVTTVLGNAEAFLNNIFTPPAGMSADMNRILNTFAMAYGETAPPEPKHISFDPTEFALLATQAITWRGLTSLNMFSAPSAVIASSVFKDNVPILVPKDSDHTSDGVKQLFSLWRPSTWINSPAAGRVSAAHMPNSVGLWDNTAAVNSGTLFTTYIQSGAGSGPIELSGIDAITYASVFNSATEVMTDETPWGAEAVAGLTAAAGENRMFRDWDIYYVPALWLMEETAYIGEKIFIGDIVSRNR